MALKLFISHSSRLRDDETGDAQARANWQLLQDTCGALGQAYCQDIDILVDYAGLQPSDRWEECLDEWLYDCHAGVLLLSKRARQSAWVRKEATILCWRAANEADFRLFLVLLDGQQAADLEADDYFSTLGLRRFQCVKDVRTADEIVANLQPRLGECVALKSRPQTPFERLVGGVEKILAREIDADGLAVLWQTLNLGGPPPASALDPARRLARGIAGHLFRQGEEALPLFTRLMNEVSPRPDRRRAEEVLRHIRALWVDVGAARMMADARQPGDCLVLNGHYVAKRVPELKADYFTLERYGERAWPGDRRTKIIPISQLTSAEEIWHGVRAQFWPENVSPTPPAHVIDGLLRKHDGRLIILLMPPGDLLPDPAVLGELKARAGDCPSLLFIVDVGERMPDPLGYGMQAIVPEIHGWDTECTQIAAECAARAVINQD
jgi:hypothetical protein